MIQELNWESRYLISGPNFLLLNSLATQKSFEFSEPQRFHHKIKTVIAVSTKEEKSKIHMYRHTVIYDSWLMKSSIQLCFTHSNVRLLKESLDYYIRPMYEILLGI